MDEPEFCNIHYVREMLLQVGRGIGSGGVCGERCAFAPPPPPPTTTTRARAQVFSALDRAQRKLGFHHADLGMRNVMEHYPE